MDGFLAEDLQNIGLICFICFIRFLFVYSMVSSVLGSRNVMDGYLVNLETWASDGPVACTDGAYVKRTRGLRGAAEGPREGIDGGWTTKYSKNH